uniref:Endonuclease/exonuclease/phosphatase domain-containing protein n=1 Tax=Mastacembelus armatus TaxID=205130 RepID=A0A7N9ATU4_9TELE
LQTIPAFYNNNLSFMSWTIKGLNNEHNKKKKILSFIKSKKCDIVFVQERNLWPQESQTLCVGWVGFVGAASGSSKSRGVTTLISKYLQFQCFRQSRDEAGRILLIKTSRLQDPVLRSLVNQCSVCVLCQVCADYSVIRLYPLIFN